MLISCYCYEKVGDPKQLPATVISDIASKFSYECSMFERLQRAGHPVIMLTQQVPISCDHCSQYFIFYFLERRLLLELGGGGGDGMK